MADSVMLAFFLDSSVAEELALEGYEPAEDLHVTLAYLGQPDGLDRELLEKAVAAFAAEAPKVSGEISGWGIFNTEDGPVLHASVDSAELGPWRQRLITTLEAVGAPVSHDHGFTPHITLAYLGDDDLPFEELATRPLEFGEVVLAWGDDRSAFSLGAVTARRQRIPVDAQMRRELDDFRRFLLKAGATHHGYTRRNVGARRASRGQRKAEAVQYFDVVVTNTRRGQVAHFVECPYFVLAHGNFGRLQIAATDKEGVSRQLIADGYDVCRHCMGALVTAQRRTAALQEMSPRAYEDVSSEQVVEDRAKRLLARCEAVKGFVALMAKDGWFAVTGEWQTPLGARDPLVEVYDNFDQAVAYYTEVCAMIGGVPGIIKDPPPSTPAEPSSSPEREPDSAGAGGPVVIDLSGRAITIKAKRNQRR
jgi:2'-5' RNA ligase